MEASPFFFFLSPLLGLLPSSSPAKDRGLSGEDPRAVFLPRLSSSSDQPCSAVAAQAKLILSLLPFACIRASAPEVLYRNMYCDSQAVRCAHRTDKVPFLLALFIPFSWKKNVAVRIVPMLEAVPARTCKGGIRTLHSLSEVRRQKPRVVFALIAVKGVLAILYLSPCFT